jgi:hypothetical protein
MPNVDSFLDGIARDLQATLPGLHETARRSIEERIAMLTDYRLNGMDEAGFARLLATMASGRSPVALQTVQPQVFARELADRWARHTQAARVPALT